MLLCTVQEIDEVVELIPHRYNRKIELTAEVTEAGPNQFEFVIATE